MKLSIHDYATVLYEAVASQPKQAGEAVERFVKVLQRDRTANLLPLILKEVEAIAAEQEGRLLVTVTTSEALTPTQQKEIIETLKSRYPKKETVTINSQVDPSIIGGVRLEIGNEIIDHTIKTKLDELAGQLRK